MTARRSISIDGLSHQASLPVATRIGPLLVSSVIASFDPGTRNVPASLDAQIANLLEKRERAVYFRIVRAHALAEQAVVQVHDGRANRGLARLCVGRVVGLDAAEQQALPGRLAEVGHRDRTGRLVGHAVDHRAHQ